MPRACAIFTIPITNFIYGHKNASKQNVSFFKVEVCEFLSLIHQI